MEDEFRIALLDFLNPESEEEDLTNSKLLDISNNLDLTSRRRKRDDDNITSNESKSFKSSLPTKSISRTSPAVPTKSTPMEISVYNFYPQLLQSLNCGDIEKQSELIERFVDKDCVLNISTPAFQRQTRGIEAVHEIFHYTNSKFPDTVVFHKGMLAKRDPESGRVFLVHKYTFSGTKANEVEGTWILGSSPDSLETCHFFSLSQCSFVQQMDRSQLREDQVRALEGLEQAMNSQGKLIIVFVKGMVEFLLSEDESKVCSFTIQWRVQSFRECH